MSRPLCIYHGNCDDGFASAWIVRRALKGEVDFYPGVYQQEPPDVTGRDVIMVDFSYKRPVIEKMAETANTILILDHHKTAKDDLSGVLGKLGKTAIKCPEKGVIFSETNVHVVFDMDRSGAMLTWDWFNPFEEPLMFIKYIQDRDLWRKSFPHGDEFTIALRSYHQDFKVWDELTKSPAHLIEEGKNLQRYYRLRVEELKKSAYRAVLAGHAVWVVNAPYFAASEVAGELAERGFQEEGLKFGASFFEVSAGRWQYSLRSRGDFNVGEIAKIFGGGGHPGAAGFTVDQPIHTALSPTTRHLVDA